MVNRVTLIGNLGRDPEIRTLETGAMVAKFSVATDEGYRDTSGNWVERTEWHEVVAWRQLAERAQSTLKKGMLVYVEGKLSTRKWKDQNDVEKYRTEVVANYFRIVNSRGLDKHGEGDPSTQQPASVQEGNASGEAGSFPEQSYEDDLPF
ncbi:MAG: single-stranded DNA-binding protein [Saprospirales bacterium]|nr:single-stranded DNA-binding protein [Saprospirales bacterium]MBK8489932.1 single-stranded DNA-binding protein [Saprospirales bacterium]